jgi:hypothetical protein
MYEGQSNFSLSDPIPQPCHQNHGQPTYAPQSSGQPSYQQSHLPSNKGRTPAQPVPYAHLNMQQAQLHYSHANGGSTQVLGNGNLRPLHMAQTTPPNLTPGHVTSHGSPIYYNNSNQPQPEARWTPELQQQYVYQFENYRTLQLLYLRHDFPHLNSQQLQQMQRDNPGMYYHHICDQMEQQIEQQAEQAYRRRIAEQQQTHQRQIAEQQVYQRQIAERQVHQHHFEEQQH